MFDYDDLNSVLSVFNFRRHDCDWIILRFKGDNLSEKTYLLSLDIPVILEICVLVFSLKTPVN